MTAFPLQNKILIFRGAEGSRTLSIFVRLGLHFGAQEKPVPRTCHKLFCDLF